MWFSNKHDFSIWWKTFLRSDRCLYYLLRWLSGYFGKRQTQLFCFSIWRFYFKTRTIKCRKHKTNYVFLLLLTLCFDNRDKKSWLQYMRKNDKRKKNLIKKPNLLKTEITHENNTEWNWKEKFELKLQEISRGINKFHNYVRYHKG